MTTTEAVDAMVKVMAPYVGDTVARSATEAHCQKLGIAGAAVTRDEVEALLVKVGGFVFLCAGDAWLAYFQSLGELSLDPLLRATHLLACGLIAGGAQRQPELLKS